ncbi:VOC family protein [Catellatospora tritici]|uniref:VOC family protein n=1 Tax=Catellatospora tritici TaxID=2851566 RepID=UPI001C2D7D3C|nr:VOC family protein [Catellatospora tritici]MBV1855637.1 VOC family protein [Catellatospora tritici]
MARLGRKPVRPGRVTIAVCLGALGLFVISMSAGMASWPLGAVGAAMLVVAVALLTTASMRGADKAFVAGTIHVVKVSDPPHADYGRCEMQVLLDAPGHPGQTVNMIDPKVQVLKWPDVGDTLPVLVAVGDARRIKIQWDRVGTHGERYSADLSGTYVEDDPHAPTYDGGYEEQHYVDPHHIDDDYDPYDAYYDFAGRSDETYVGYRDDDPVDLDAVPVSAVPVEAVPVSAMPVDADRAHREPPRPPTPAAPTSPSAGAAPIDGTLEPLSRRPSPHHRRADAATAVLEGELVADVPAPRQPPLGDVSAIDFSDVPEPAAPSAPAAAAPAAPAAPEPPAQPEPVPAAQTAGVDELLIASPQARPAVASSIHGVGITLLVSDLDRSRAFYHDLLGFYEVDGGPGNLVLASGETRIVLRKANEPSPVNRRLVHLNLEVSDVDAVYEELKVRGVKFGFAPRVVNQGERLELWAASFKDPDGHGIGIIEWKAKAA